MHANPIRRPSLVSLAALALLACGRGGTPRRDLPRGPATAMSAAAPRPSATASATAATFAVDLVAPDRAATVFAGARSDKACKAQTVELANYQQRGDIALAGRAGEVAAVWRVRLGGKRFDQVAFGSYDEEGRGRARTRAVGTTSQDAGPRVFPSGGDWNVVWFDDKGLAYARPRAERTPPPDIAHLGAVGPDLVGDVALNSSPSGAVLAAAPFGSGRNQLGIFLLAPVDPGAPPFVAFGVTHHAKAPHRPALAADEKGTFVAWYEDDALVASHFDPAAKETDATCTIAPKSASPRERLGLATTATGATAIWVEGGFVHARALDASGCPASPIWKLAEGRFAQITSLGDTAIVAWVTGDGRLVAARLGPTGAAAARGLEASEGSTGVKDPPSVTVFGNKIAFGWSEVMSPAISTKRLVLRILDLACLP